MRFVRSIFAVLLLAVWPVVTSHALLERFGVIHEVHEDHDHHSDGGSHEHNADNHDFADGGYIAKTTPNTASLRVDICLYEAAWLTALLQSAEMGAFDAFGPAPPGVAPPEYLHSWNFLHRTAIDARAPSFVS